MSAPTLAKLKKGSGHNSEIASLLQGRESRSKKASSYYFATPQNEARKF